MVRSASFVLFFISFTPFRWICSCPHYSTRLRKCTLHPHFSPLPSNSTALPRKNSDSTGGRVQKRLTNVHSWRTIYEVRRKTPHQPWLRSRISSVPSGLAIAGAGKGAPPKAASLARGCRLGPGRICPGLSSLKRWSADQGRRLFLSPCLNDMGIFYMMMKEERL